MGRQNKAGLDYFELDCQWDQKVRLIQAEFGLKGVAVFVLLLQEIYGNEGWYIRLDEDRLLLFMSEHGVASGDYNLIREIIDACIRREIFSADVYKKYGVLTSVGVQKRYLKAVSRRESVELIKEYLLISVDKISSNVNIKAISVCRNEENVCRNAQSREEKSREEKSREDKYLCSESENLPSEQPVVTLTLNDKSEYPFYQSDLDKYAELYPGIDILQQFKKMVGWLDANPARRKTKAGIKRFVNSWLSKAQDRSGGYKQGEKFTAEDWNG